MRPEDKGIVLYHNRSRFQDDRQLKCHFIWQQGSPQLACLETHLVGVTEPGPTRCVSVQDSENCDAYWGGSFSRPGAVKKKQAFDEMVLFER